MPHKHVWKQWSISILPCRDNNCQLLRDSLNRPSLVSSAGRGNDVKINTLQYSITIYDLASATRQDENTIHDKLMQNSHRLTSKADY